MEKLPLRRDRAIIIREDGTVKLGTITVRSITCGKPNCTKCPHRSYAYVQYRDGGKVKSKYLGTAKESEKLLRSIRKKMVRSVSTLKYEYEDAVFTVETLDKRRAELSERLKSAAKKRAEREHNKIRAELEKVTQELRKAEKEAEETRKEYYASLKLELDKLCIR